MDIETQLPVDPVPVDEPYVPVFTEIIVPDPPVPDLTETYVEVHEYNEDFEYVGPVNIPVNKNGGPLHKPHRTVLEAPPGKDRVWDPDKQKWVKDNKIKDDVYVDTDVPWDDLEPHYISRLKALKLYDKIVQKYVDAGKLSSTDPLVLDDLITQKQHTRAQLKAEIVAKIKVCDDFGKAFKAPKLEEPIV
jgi:hypothetical protein